MSSLWRTWLDPSAGRTTPAGSADACVSRDPRLGTNVAIAMPAAAAVAAVLSAGAAGDGFEMLGPGATVALALAAVVFGRYPLELGPRTLYALETPIVLLAGMLGGPLAGAVVGAGSGLGDVGAVWRRRLTYTGIAALQGILAGHAGLAWQHGRLGALEAAVLSAVGVLAVSSVGLALVQLDRRSFSPARLRLSALTEAAGLALALAPVLLLAVSFEARPALVLVATGSVAVTAIVAARFGVEREAASAERHRALLRDWLTGAASRAFLEVELERTREAVLRGSHPAGLLLDGALGPADVFDHADRALYRAKIDRDRTCIVAPSASTAPAHGLAVPSGG